TSKQTRLRAQPQSDGTKVAILPGGGKINLDLTTPQEPVATPEPDVGERFYGALSGNLSVSPSGAATYTVRIAIPPGIAGMAPNLSLVYSSQAGDGIAGQGWEPAGLSMIHRCALTSVQDVVPRPVMMNGLEPPNPPATPPPTAFDL